MVVSSITFGQEYKITEVIPIDVLLYMAFSEHWKLSEKLTRVHFVPSENHTVQYTLPIILSWDKPSETSPAMPTFDIKSIDMKMIVDDSNRVWRVGYAPDIDVLYIGTRSDGQICFKY